MGLLSLGLLYWRIVVGYSPVTSYVRWPDPPPWVHTLYAARWVVHAGVTLAGAFLVYAECSAQAASRWLRRLLARRSSTLALVVLSTLLFGSFLLQPGNYIVADYAANVTTPWLVVELLRRGEWFPFWTTVGHLGTPFLQFHYSIYYHYVALVSVLVPDFFAATEIAALILFVLSGCFMYLYVQQLTHSRLAAVVSCVCWSASFYRVSRLSLGGNYPLDGIFFGLWPLHFYLIERVLEVPPTRRRVWWCALALCSALSLWNHVLHGAWMAPLGVLYALTRLWPERSHGKHVLQRLGPVLGAYVAGVLMSLYQVLPILIESNLVPAHSVPNAIGMADILDPRRTWYGGYIGYAILGLSLLAVIAIPVTRYTPGYAIAVQAVLGFGLTFAPRYFPWLPSALDAVPLGSLVYVKGAMRYLFITFGPLTVLVGILAHVLPTFIRRAARTHFPPNALGGWPSNPWVFERAALLVMFLVLLEALPLSLMVNYRAPNDNLFGHTGRLPLLAVLAQKPDKTARVFDVADRLTPSYVIPMLSGFPSLGSHYEEAPDSFRTLRSLDDLIHADVAAGAFRSHTLALLRQLNIAYLITAGVGHVGHPLSGVHPVAHSESATLWHVAGATPIVATKAPMADGRVVTGNADAVPVTIIRHRDDWIVVEITFDLSQRAFLQVAYSDYPNQTLSLDATRVAATPTPLGLIGVWADPGIHTLVITPGLSRLRQRCLIAGVLVTLIVFSALCWPRNKVRAP